MYESTRTSLSLQSYSYTLPPCLTMFLIRVTLLFIDYFKGRHYISIYTDNTVHTGIKML